MEVLEVEGGVGLMVKASAGLKPFTQISEDGFSVRSKRRSACRSPTLKYIAR